MQSKSTGGTNTVELKMNKLDEQGDYWQNGEYSKESDQM